MVKIKDKIQYLTEDKTLDICVNETINEGYRGYVNRLQNDTHVIDNKGFVAFIEVFGIVSIENEKWNLKNAGAKIFCTDKELYQSIKNVLQQSEFYRYIK